jgi:beta-lactamase class A
LSELLYLSIVNSCNVATGIIADFVGRDNVNLFIGEKLNLPNTSVYSATKPNTTTVSDLLSCLQQITEQQILTDSERDYLYDLLAQTKRRGVIRKSLPTNIKVFSKGGTTFSGLRRDASIVFDLQFPDPGFIIVVQLSDASHAYSLIDNLAAKFHLGPKAKRLQQLDSEFNQYVHQLLNA